MSTTPIPIQQDSGSDQQSGPATTAPDLSGLAAPGPNAAPQTAPVSDSAALQSQMAPFAATQQAELQKASESAQPAAPQPPGKHDTLRRMVEGLAVGLSSAATAMASHGERGGAPDVQAYYANKQNQAIQAQNAALAQRNMETQQHLMAANVAEKQMNNIMLMHTIPHDMTMQDLQEKKGQQEVTAGDTAADARAQELFESRTFVSPGYDVNPSTGQVQRIGQGRYTSQTPTGAGPTPQDSGSDQQSGPQTGSQTPNASPTGTTAPGTPSGLNQTVPRDGQYFLRQQSIFDASTKEITAANGGKTTPLLAAAQKIIDNPQSTVLQINNAVLGVQRQANLSADTVKRLKDVADSQKSQQEVTAGNRPKNLDDAVGRLTQAQQAYTANPTPDNKLLVTNAQEARDNFLTAESSLARVKQVAQDGKPEDLAPGLVNGDLAWSQVVSTRRPEFVTAAFKAANEYSLKTTGKPFSAQVNESNFKQATNPQVLQKLKMVEGMTEKGGSIEIAQTAAANLPQFNERTANKIFNVVSGELGNTALSNFHTAMLGLADEYSQVMGTGGGSDVSRQQALDILHDNYSKQQLSGAIDIMRRDIAARKRGLIGDNPALQQLFPDTSTTQSAPAGATGKAPGPDGKMYYHDAKGKNLGLVR
jgi:hypothetical protein